MKTYYTSPYGHSRNTRHEVRFHDGTSTHKDGSKFWDYRAFSSKPKLAAFVKELEDQGYSYKPCEPIKTKFLGVVML